LIHAAHEFLKLGSDHESCSLRIVYSKREALIVTEGFAGQEIDPNHFESFGVGPVALPPDVRKAYGFPLFRFRQSEGLSPSAHQTAKPQSN
jgi:hypothetical protein